MGGDPHEPEPSGDDKKLFEQLLRHVVSFAGAYRSKKDPEKVDPFNYSGFVITVGKQWYIVTAGHILQDLDTALKRGDIEFTERKLVDYYGPNAKFREPIPFDYEAHPRIHVNKDRLDFALILLSDIEVQGLQANGVIPFTFEGKPERPWSEYDRFVLVGFVKEHLRSDVDRSTGEVRLEVRAGVVPVERLQSAPTTCNKTRFPRFIGKLTDNQQPSSIFGMSGSPIIGMKRTDRGVDYWVVAIQSHWLPSERIIFGCPMPVMFDVLRRAIEQAESGKRAPTTGESPPDGDHAGSK
jgi:hypothetical protein